MHNECTARSFVHKNTSQVDINKCIFTGHCDRSLKIPHTIIVTLLLRLHPYEIELLNMRLSTVLDYYSQKKTNLKFNSSKY